MTEQPNSRKSALWAILLEVIVLVLALIFWGVSLGTPIATIGALTVNIVALASILLGVAVILGIGVGIFLLVLVIEAGKLNVRKVVDFDLEKLAKLVLYLILILGIIYVIALIVGGAIYSQMQWGLIIIGFVGFGIMIFMGVIGLLSFLGLYQGSRLTPPAATEKPAS